MMSLSLMKYLLSKNGYFSNIENFAKTFIWHTSNSKFLKVSILGVHKITYKSTMESLCSMFSYLTFITTCSIHKAMHSILIFNLEFCCMTIWFSAQSSEPFQLFCILNQLFWFPMFLKLEKKLRKQINWQTVYEF